jgi:hypothetical protein
MSTDILTFQNRYYQARQAFEHEQAKRGQAEDRAREAEEATRRAEERAEHLEGERDAWSALARKFFGPRLTYFEPELGELKVCQIGDLLYDLHSQGTDVDDDGLLAGLVNDWTEK